MVVLDRFTLVVIQFVLPGPDIVPPFIKSMGKRMGKQLPFKGKSSGIEACAPIRNCTLEELPDDLERMGYKMVGASYFERPSKDPRNKKPEHLVRFVLAHPESAEQSLLEASADFTADQDIAMREFRDMCMGGMCKSQMFSNPICVDGKELLEQRELRINLTEYQPLFHPDGTPVKDFVRDPKTHKAIGRPRPIRPEKSVHFEGNGILTFG